MSTDQAENIQERNKEIVARYWDALYSHDWDVIASFFTDTANYVDTGTGESMGWRSRTRRDRGSPVPRPRPGAGTQPC